MQLVIQGISQEKIIFLKENLKAWGKPNFGEIEAHPSKWKVVVANFVTIEEVFELSEEEQVKRREADFKLNEALLDEAKF